jgi:MFS family permease
MVGIGSIVGRLAVGYSLDRFDSGVVAALCVTTPLLASALLLLLPHSIAATLLATFVIGIAIGGEFDAAAYLIGQYFGLQSFGAIFGIIAGMVSLTAGVGPAAVNHLYDVAGSYHPFLWACLPICLTASLLFLSLRAQEPLAAA